MVWILFYELDAIVIGKFLGVDKVAIYAIAWSFATLFRTIFGTLYSPFAIRVNHFIGIGDDKGLKSYCLQLISLSTPIVIISTVAFALVAKPFVLTWVGIKYMESINIARLFSLLFTLSFISYSTSMFLTAKIRIKEMSIIATIQPVIYWLGVIFTHKQWGLLSFAVFKLAATVVSEVCYLYLLIKLLEISLKDIFKNTIYPILLPLMFLMASLTYVNSLFALDKSKYNLLLVLATTGAGITISLSIQYFTNSGIRSAVKNIVRNVT